MTNIRSIASALLLASSLAVCLAPLNASATSSILDTWRGQYPQSRSADIRCQLCHIQREGGSPWNAYGWDIRRTFRDPDLTPRTIERAIEVVQTLNSDDDTNGINNLTEINSSEQPGWREGRVNIGYDRFANEEGVFFPPVTINPYPNKLPVSNVPVELVELAKGFTAPLGGAVAPVPSLRGQLFVVDQVGIIWRVDLESGEKSQYLEVQSRLVQLGRFEPGGYDERGLLGFVFHPQFSSNGLVYLHISEPVSGTADFSTMPTGIVANHQSVIVELTISNPTAQTGIAVITGQRDLLRIDQPQFNHNGGDLQFDNQGLLYIALGDGGNADDQGPGHGENGNGGNPSNPLGSILRVDPLGRNVNSQYSIPDDNPFINRTDRLDEIYAYGFRNPWKLSFDTNGKLYVADVGQNDIEEINQVNSGMHYGWRFREGSFFFDPNGEFSGIITRQFPDNLPPEELIDPLFEYDHDEGISVSGGHVYRGAENRTLRGKFIFADFQKRLFVGNLNTGDVTALDLTPDIFVYSIAKAANGELYVMGNQNAATSGSTGKVYKLQSTLPPVSDDICVPVKTKAGNNRAGAISLICL